MKTVLITGSNRGIGLEFVRQYINEGWQVIACCRNTESAHQLNNIKDSNSNRLIIHKLDVSNFKMIEELASTLHDTPIDLLINNAGIYGGNNNTFGSIDYQDWTNAFVINTMAALKIAESFVSNIECSNIKKMVFLSSQMGSISDNGSGQSYIYRSTKTALNSVVKSLSIDLKHKGIKVLTLHPGWVLTDMGGTNAQITTEESVKSIKNIIDNMNMNNSGSFLDYEGKTILW